MTSPDLNLLVTLDVLLSERSVAGAARRLRLSPSAMSRALARLRDSTGDPLLVRAGRGLVPTPRAIALRERVGSVVEEALKLLGPADRLDLSRLVRTFTFRSREGFVENFGPALIARVEAEAPGVRLSFLAKADRDSAPLRDGRVDLETGVVGATTGPELRASTLFRDRFVGVVRPGHRLAGAATTPAAYAGGRHVLVAASGSDRGPIDDALHALGLQREIATVVGGFAAALALCRASDMIATVPERHTGNLRDGLVTFPLPFAMPEIPISLLWHPRLDSDPAHRWLRGCVKEVCAP
ncbi:MAG: LysR family transcriptional regulator [Allosphingosinicella sp.]